LVRLAKPSPIAKPVMKAGVPGDTTASALKRLQRDVLSRSPDMVHDILKNVGNQHRPGLIDQVHISPCVTAVPQRELEPSDYDLGALPLNRFNDTL